MQDFKNILVIDLAFIGDVVLATPVLRSLREAYPQAHIVMLTVPLTASIAALNPFVDTVLTYDKRGAQRGFMGMVHMARQLRAHHFDLAVCLNFAVRGAVVAWLAGIPVRAGYDAQHAGRFLTYVQSHVRQGLKHERLNHLEILQCLRIPPSEDTSLQLRVPPEVAASVQQKLPQLAVRPYVVLCPLGNSPKKALQTAQLQAVSEALRADYQLFVIGGPNQKAALQDMAAACAIPASHVLAGRLTLPELAAFLQGAVLLVATDTGPAHIAQAVHCPSVVVYGPMSPLVWGLVNARDCALCADLPCVPCNCKGKCPAVNCIARITPVELVAAVRKRLTIAER